MAAACAAWRSPIACSPASLPYIFPHSYLHALALLLAVEGIEGLAGTTRANAARLDGALEALATARRLDRVAFGERDTAMEEVMEDWFEAALRVSPTDNNALLSIGLIVMFAPALTEKLRTPDPRWVPLKWRPLHFGAQAMQRARRYVDASMAGAGADRFHVATNHAWFQALHVAPATLLSARTRKMTIAGGKDEFVKLSVSAAQGGLLLLEAGRLGTVSAALPHRFHIDRTHAPPLPQPSPLRSYCTRTRCRSCSASTWIRRLLGKPAAAPR